MVGKSGDFIKDELERYRSVFEEYLVNCAEERRRGVPERLFEAMEYSLNAGSKRLRPVLCMAAAERCGCPVAKALPLALGFEMLHTSTLIHDDMPCMDNDDMRRGKPSNHKIFGEPLALLAGDAMLARSIGYPLSHTNDIPPKNLLAAVKILSDAAGPSGVQGGQVLDMDAERVERECVCVSKVAALKTGALIKAALRAGAALGTGDKKILNSYERYGTHFGAAFQIVDDILDVVGTAESLGKTPGKDSAQGKVTYVTVFGIEKASKMAEDESISAKAALSGILPENDFLLLLPEFLMHRTY